MRPDQRSNESAAWRWVYKDPRWRGTPKHRYQDGIRFQALVRDLFKCQRCGCLVVTGHHNKTHPRLANVNHIKPHKGDPALAFDLNNTETVCQTCHSGEVQRTEKRGFSSAVDESGFPTDPRHPFNR